MSTDGAASIEDTLASGAAQETPRNVVFAAPADDPRARRPADVVQLMFALFIMMLAAWSYSGDRDIDERVMEFFSGGLPGWISGTFTIIYVAGAVYAFGLLLAILIFGNGRAAVARDMFLAALLAVVLATAMAGLTGPEWVDILPELLEKDGWPSYPVMRLTLAVAVVGVARPYLAAPMRGVGSRLLWGMAIAALILHYGTVTSVIGAVALGSVAAAAVRLLFGSGVGIPSKARIIDDLASIGLPGASVEYLPDQPIGTALLRADWEGGDALVKVYGRDATDAATTSRVWRSLFYRDHDRALTATGLQQVEHESLMLMSARRAGAPVSDLVGWGRGPTGNSLLVTQPIGAASMSSMASGDIDDAILEACWEAIAKLRDARISHGSIDPRRVVVADGTVLLRDLSGAKISPDDNAMATDVAQMLVTTAVAVGPERAIAAARSGIGDDVIADSLRLLQGNALSSVLQADAKQAGLKVKDLRAAVADAVDREPPELVQLERVTWGNVAMVGLTLFAVYALLSALSDIGFDTIADEVADAEWAWIVIALITAQLTNIGEYFSLTGVVHGSVPFGPTIMFRYALSFISLAVPSDAGAIAMNIRYMQKLGESTAAAVAQGPLLTLFSKGFDIILLIIAGRVIGQTIDLDDIDSGPVLRLLLLVVGAIAIGLIVMFSVPRFRNRALPHIKDALRAVKSSVTDPQRLLRIAGGTLMQKILFAITLSAAVAAYGESLTFSEALFVNTAISLFVGLIPVPGGVGVAEAALTAGLTAMGVPEEAAVAAAITHRMVTAYLPPVFGWWASRWLTERDYL